MRNLLFLLFSLFSFTLCRAQTHRVAIQPAPSWITPTSIDYGLSSMDNDAEDGFVDLDYEVQVSISSQTRYIKKSVKILSESGVENSSELSVDFDPLYQKLIFHTVALIRNGQRIDKLPTARFKVVEQEKDLDKHLYDGSLTAVSFLEDVRSGDVLEYSYSLVGFNPIYKGKYASLYDVQYSVPIYNLLYKLVVPPGRTITVKNRGTALEPVIERSPSGTAYEWRAQQVAPLHVATNTPDWYDPFPMIMVSEFASWKEVSDWARALYPFDVAVSPALQMKIEEIRRKNATPEGRTLAALRFVQDEIRYTGIEAGENSHKPHHPDQIFSQRFGDCKDKTYLLCIMLRKMGITADPVLINTESGKAILNWLPSASIFDHVTARVTINGRVYWFDPTISYQRGDINSISYPDYQCGLVISDTTRALTTIPLAEKGSVVARESFNVPDWSGLARFTVKTDYSGKYADNTRDEFRNNSRYVLMKKFKDFYAAYFSKIKADSLSYSDNETSGVVTTVEYYTISDFWDEKDGMKKAALQPFLIDEVLKKPDETSRTAPFGMSFPVHYKEDVEVDLPEEWSITSASDNIETPASVFHYDYSVSGNHVRLSYEYKNLKDFIAPEEMDRYMTAFKKINDNAGFELSGNAKGTTYIKSSAVVSGEPSIYPALYTLLVIAVLITMGIRRKRQHRGY